MSIDTVYKVVQVRGDSLISCVPVNDERDVTYAPGRKAGPPIGLLYAFKALTDAEEFLRVVTIQHATNRLKLGPHQIWKCNAKISAIPPMRLNYPYFVNGSCSVDFWTRMQNGISLDDFPAPRAIASCPEGTILCEWIELKEKLGNQDEIQEPERKKDISCLVRDFSRVKTTDNHRIF